MQSEFFKMSAVGKTDEQEGLNLHKAKLTRKSSSCDDLLEEQLENDPDKPVTLIKPQGSVKYTKAGNESCSPAKGGGKKHRNARRKISLPWFRQPSFGFGLSKLKLSKQNTIAGSVPESQVPSAALLSGNLRQNVSI